MQVLDPLNDKREAVVKYSDMVISTLCVKHDLLCVGGLNGKSFLALICSQKLSEFHYRQ